MQRTMCVIAAALASLVATGCGPVIDGAVGLRVSSSGELYGVVEACDGSFGRAGMFADSKSEDQDIRSVGDWVRFESAKIPKTSTWSLSDVASSTKVTARKTVEISDLDADKSYVLWAGPASYSKTFGDIAFTRADVRSLAADRVLMPDIESWDVDQQEHAPLMAVTRKAFSKLACSAKYQNG